MGRKCIRLKQAQRAREKLVLEPDQTMASHRRKSFQCVLKIPQTTPYVQKFPCIMVAVPIKIHPFPIEFTLAGALIRVTAKCSAPWYRFTPFPIEFTLAGAFISVTTSRLRCDRHRPLDADRCRLPRSLHLLPWQRAPVPSSLLPDMDRDRTVMEKSTRQRRQQ
ncbi:hypothetical protein Bbelb_034820 [Branchiostoma belcheri]|nr:hypothetical protein Bbelb_034820 [Branchiostoma belcheri]